MNTETRIEELRTEQSALRELETHPGWLSWLVGITGEATTRRNMVFNTPMRGLDDAFVATRLMGEVTGLFAAKDWILHRLEDIRVNLEQAIAEEGEEGKEWNEKKNTNPQSP